MYQCLVTGLIQHVAQPQPHPQSSPHIFVLYLCWALVQHSLSQNIEISPLISMFCLLSVGLNFISLLGDLIIYISSRYKCQAIYRLTHAPCSQQLTENCWGPDSFIHFHCVGPHSAQLCNSPPSLGSWLCQISNALDLATELGFCHFASGCCPGHRLCLPSGSSCSWPLQGLTLLKPLCSLRPCPYVIENLHEKGRSTGWNFLHSCLSGFFTQLSLFPFPKGSRKVHFSLEQPYPWEMDLICFIFSISSDAFTKIPLHPITQSVSTYLAHTMH